MVFQNYNLIDYLTTVENVELGGSGNAEKLLEEVGIGKEFIGREMYFNYLADSNSVVAIARALASDAHVLLAVNRREILTKLPLMKSLLY